MTRKRVGFLQELLKFVGLGGRLRLEWISSAEAQKFVKVVTDFTEQIRNLGRTPLAQSYAQTLEGLELSPMLSAAGGSGRACRCSESAASVAKDA
jgi:hypothetical protein